MGSLNPSQKFRAGLIHPTSLNFEARNPKFRNKFKCLNSNIPNFIFHVLSFAMEICFGFRYSNFEFIKLFPHNFDNESFTALPVKFGIKHLLPGAEV
jgi:hypothetical protein